jgi:hypothetical protein
VRNLRANQKIQREYPARDTACECDLKNWQKKNDPIGEHLKPETVIL